MDNEKQKPRKKKKSSIPIYAVGLVWISYAIEGKLTSFGGVIGCAALSLAAYFVLKLIFPDRMEEAEKQPEQKPAETQPARSRRRRSRRRRSPPEIRSWMPGSSRDRLRCAGFRS